LYIELLGERRFGSIALDGGKYFLRLQVLPSLASTSFAFKTTFALKAQVP
jgi:hypothetical protein